MCTIDERKINSVNFVLDSQNTVNESQIHSVNVIPETQITAKESLIHSINLIPDSQSETQNHLKRYLYYNLHLLLFSIIIIILQAIRRDY